MPKTFSLFLFFTLITTIVHAQFHEEKCIYGNCKNGSGIKRVTGNKYKPFPFDLSPVILTQASYFYYQVGEFKGGDLSGKGYRISPWGFKTKGTEDWLISMVKNNTAFKPDPKIYDWFETGEYSNGFLNGKGIIIEYDPRNNRPSRIRDGVFKNGMLHGKGLKMVPRGVLLTVVTDSLTGKLVMTWGRQFQGDFDNDICMNCTLTEKKDKYGEGHITGEKIQEDFLTGWVIKDFETEPYNDQIKNVPVYKALYIGGFEITRLPSLEMSSNSKTVDLGGGNTYTGEVDDKGQPFGFGTITYFGNKDLKYKGFVDNGKPQGFGYLEMEKNPYQHIIGGYYRNDVIMYGCIYKPSGEIVVELFGDKSGSKDPRFNNTLLRILDGPYSSYYYNYDNKERVYRVRRVESGERINGYEKNVYVSMGQTAEEKRKQRVVTNGSISISDLLIGDVVVIKGMASPVVNNTAGIFYLKNGKQVSSLSANKVQLSKHKETDFISNCTICSGTGQQSYTYQRPPEVVSYTRYTPRTIVGDYTIYTYQEAQITSYTKNYPPEQRVRTCDSCKGTGKLKDLKEMPE